MSDAMSQTGGGVNVSEFYVLQPDHPAYRLNGCLVAVEADGQLGFQFQQGGSSVVVLKATAPLRIEAQSGLVARLRSGWDGTLGYAHYALEIEASAAGVGRVRLGVKPVPAGTRQPVAVFEARPSRFPDSPGAFGAWQQEWRRKLTHRLMGGGLPERVPLEAEVLDNEDYPLFTLRRVRYRSQSDRQTSLLLSMPKNVTGPVPLLLALHGHEATWGEADAGAFKPGHNDDFCAYFAERGWAVVQPATMNHTLQHQNWTLLGEWTWDAMIALDYAVGQHEVNAGRVAVCGLSTGAQLAMNMLALDGRLRAGVVGCILSTWHHYRERMRIPPHCDCGTLGQLGEFIEQCDWSALAVPKPVQFQHGRKDVSFCPGADPALLDLGWNTAVMPEDEFAAVYKEVERAYSLGGTTGKTVDLHIHNEVHRVDSQAAFGFLER